LTAADEAEPADANDVAGASELEAGTDAVTAVDPAAGLDDEDEGAEHPATAAATMARPAAAIPVGTVLRSVISAVPPCDSRLQAAHGLHALDAARLAMVGVRLCQVSRLG
jgi:hypothetical protein